MGRTHRGGFLKHTASRKACAFIRLLIVGILFSCAAGQVATDEIVEPDPPGHFVFSVGQSGVEIRGTLKNYDTLKRFVYEGATHVAIAKEGQKVDLLISPSGNVIIDDKNFPQTAIENDGSFKFVFASLSAGEYLLFIQPLQNIGFLSIIDLATGKPLKIKISQSGKETDLIDLGLVNAGAP